SQAWRDLKDEFQERIVAISLRIAQSRPLYDSLRAIPIDGLPEGRRRVVEAALRDARDSGVALEGRDKERFAGISARLAALSTKFANNVLDATKAFALDLSAQDDVAGLPDSVKTLCAAAWNSAHPDAPAAATAEAGPWRVTLEQAVFGPFLQYSERRDLREKVYRARMTRASSGELDNGPVISEILALRREMAGLVGFPDYARLALDSRMAGTTEAVRSMIDRIAAASVPRAKAETDDLRAFAAANGAGPDFAPWDVAYWTRRRLESLHGYSPESLRPYFPFPNVLDALFALAKSLFGVCVEPCDGEAPVWNPDVRFFRVREPDGGATIAHFFLDPYSRPETKRGGAWMDSFRDRALLPDGSVRTPLALLCLNQAPPSGGRPSLMTLGEVETLFHEFGHSLQCMLTRVDDPECSGISNIEWDAVELASQFMENWCTRPDVLRSLSRHVETGETLPDELIAKIRGAATFCQGRAVSRQLSFAEVDLDLHERVPSPALPDAAAAWRKAAEKYESVPRMPEDRFLEGFTHIFAGGYAAGYYSYMWADILAADAFSAFEEAGADDPAARAGVGRRYAATVLAMGGSR
ncbi:MAG: M3 family metallopeptidase, partial [Kiritimatiellae bacterium]|nr:M3 family metallopeptidase [Kiritimatiellia bacterium]